MGRGVAMQDGTGRVERKASTSERIQCMMKAIP
jgi:hypothetical protein